VLAAVAVMPELRRDRALVLCFAGAVVLVANIVPRGVVVRLSGVASVLIWSGYGHLTPLEGFSYYGYPLLGMMLMAAALMRTRRLLEESAVTV
jgi:hypothetical protein